MNTTVFTMEDMEKAGDAITQAYDHVIGLYQDEEEKRKLVSWTMSLLVSHKPYMMVTSEGLTALRDEVFGSALIRDFVLALTYQFFARWAGGKQKFTELTDRLSQGTSTDFYHQRYTATPQEISQRLTSQEDALAILAHNKWLVTLLVAKIFISIVDRH